MGRHQLFDLGTVSEGGVSSEADLSSFTMAVGYLSVQAAGLNRASYTNTLCWEFNPFPMGTVGEWYQQYSWDPSSYTIAPGRRATCLLAMPNPNLAGKKIAIDLPNSVIPGPQQGPLFPAGTQDMKIPGRVRLNFLSTTFVGGVPSIDVVIEAHQRRS